MNTQLEKLDFTISSWSSHSASYHPKNITVSKPQDQSSRWSSGSNNQLQFITVKLEKISIVKTITFGKYHKVHVCNLKEFKVFGGLDESNMNELLHAGLHNDSEQETFALKHIFNGVQVPCLYIKIVPLLAWGANFNFSIWYVELRGHNQPDIVEKAYKEYTNYKETEVVRLCLKHFRQRNYIECFNSVQNQTGLQLEHPLLTELHHRLVVDGDFENAELLLNQAIERNLFDNYISDLPYKPKWTRVAVPLGMATPSMRGGHQMCIDSEANLIYLFGGWDGTRDLADFWQFNQVDRSWSCISMDTRKQNGPEPRSCHKICLDPYHKVIYALGKYVDSESRPGNGLESDFWKYDIIQQKWTKLSHNTALEGGPELIYDHQMVVDSDKSVIYVFGGRTVSQESTQRYSGLYTYNIPSNKWKLVRDDLPSTSPTIQIKSRIGHSMLFNSERREIYIFAGQRHKDFLADFYVYSIDTDTVTEISRDYSKTGGPDAGFTQRATIDPHKNEFYVLSGMMREKNSLNDTKNAFWVYNLQKGKWLKIYENDNIGSDYWMKMSNIEPRPRFAHQLVYNENTKVQYLFGGNPGETNNPNLRLDDLWELTLQRPSSQDILRRAKFQIRKLWFIEKCLQGDIQAALHFLQTKVSQYVNHFDPEESKQFQMLAMNLFSWNANKTDDLFTGRIGLYQDLLRYFPDSMREPHANLVDLVPMV
ncbi:Muskelin 1, intracellular mediator containing kelch motif [Boothiomyces sp. JEL0866]|nr:Muskelin 1, intracellular mediator containing kelch motif [Boothiomyces sp. JEL0866]